MKKSSSQIPTDLDIQALVDAQLDFVEANRVLDKINKDPVLYARYQELLTQKKLLQDWWKWVNETDKN